MLFEEQLGKQSFPLKEYTSKHLLNKAEQKTSCLLQALAQTSSDVKITAHEMLTLLTRKERCKMSNFLCPGKLPGNETN